MPQTIRINELREPWWKLCTVVSVTLAVVLFIISRNMSDVFWAGIVRLASFAGFAIAVLSGLKAMEGTLDIEIQRTGNTLNFKYLKKGEKILEDSKDLNLIESVSCMPSTSFFPLQQANVFIVRFKDSEQDFSLFHFSGRTLKIGDESAEKLTHFLKEQGVSVKRDE